MTRHTVQIDKNTHIKIVKMSKRTGMPIGKVLKKIINSVYFEPVAEPVFKLKTRNQKSI